MAAVRKGRPSSTAQNIALARAWSTRGGVLDDPHAEWMLDRYRRAVYRLGDVGPVGRLSPFAFTYLAGRTRFYDAIVRDGLDRGVTQVVLVAAGYDCRAWRLARTGVRFFEVDHPDTQADKRERLALADPGPGPAPTYIPADLATTNLDEVLYPAGFNPSIPTVFCCEGLTMYLEESAVRELLSSAARLSAAGSRLGVDFSLHRGSDEGREQMLVRLSRGVARLHGEPFHFRTRPDAAEKLLQRCGWILDEALVGSDLGERFLTPAELRKRRHWRGSFVAAATIRS